MGELPRADPEAALGEIVRVLYLRTGRRMAKRIHEVPRGYLGGDAILIQGMVDPLNHCCAVCARSLVTLCFIV